jgi:hypothetical protein
MRSKAIFWILIVIFCVVLAFRLKQFHRRPPTMGFLLRVGNFDPPENCEFSIPLVLHISSDHALRLNHEPESLDQLPLRLETILKERIRPVLYIEANSATEMREFVQILDLVRKANGKVEVRLVTPGNRKYSCIDAPPQPGA